MAKAVLTKPSSKGVKKPSTKGVSKSKPVKTKAKSQKQTDNPGQSLVGGHFLAHWLQDVSLEVSQPMGTFAPGERQLDFSIRAREVSLPQPNHLRCELRLRAHIFIPAGTVALAEISYAAVVENPQDMRAILSSLYTPARDALAGALRMAGHEPPLPTTL